MFRAPLPVGHFVEVAHCPSYFFFWIVRVMALFEMVV